MNPDNLEQPTERFLKNVGVIDQIVAQFQESVGIPEYNGIIEKLIRKAYDRIQIILSLQPSSAVPSSAMVESTFGVAYSVKIFRRPESGNMREILYDMMHEMGHCFDPQKLPPNDTNNIVLRRGREIRAWEIADQEFSTHLELAAIKQDYTDFRDNHLAKYMED